MNRQRHVREWLSVATLAFTVSMLPGSTRADSDSAADSGTAEQVAPAPTGGAAGTSATGASDGRRSQQTQIEEITVTARKREENLQSTPVSITAFSETDLKDADIRRVNEITKSVPNLTFDPAIGLGNSARIYLRGVGNGDPLSSDDPGVGVYVDGVYLPRAQGALLTVSDIERVEVLRGPQGTLFGKNTIGGAINIVSKKPDPTEFGGTAEVRIGNFQRFDTRFSVNIPLVPEMAAARISFATASRDPVVRNKGTGSDLQDDKLLGGRAQFLFLPSDDVEINLSADHSIENRKPFGGKCMVTNTNFMPEAGFGVAPAMGQLAENGNGIIEVPPAARAFSAVVGLPLSEQAGPLSDQTGATNNFFKACRGDADRSERSVASNLSFLKDKLKTFGTNGTITWNMSDNLTFKSISSWQFRGGKSRADGDYTELSLFENTRDFGKSQQDSYSQELQLTGSGMDDRLNYVVGVYGFREDNQDRNFGGVATTTPLIFSGFATSTTMIRTASGGTTPFRGAFLNDPAVQQRFLPSVRTFDGPGTPNRAVTMADIAATLAAAPGSAAANRVFALPGAVTETILNVDNKSYAAYSQATYDLTDRLSFTGGLRFTHERKRVENRITAKEAGVVGGNARGAEDVDFQFERSTRFTDFSPMANLSFQASDDMLLYMNYSKGFKSGGFNGRANAPALTNEVDDEKVTAYEIGMKSSWLDNRFVFNVAGYWNIYQDIQLTIPAGGNNQAQILILNAGENIIRGAEVEIRALPLPGLELSSALGVTNTRYTEFDDPTNLRAKDRKLLAIPNYTGNFAATYTVPAGSLGDLRLRTEWTHRGAAGTDVVESRELRRGKNGELDAQLGLLMADGKTELVLFGKNLLNREFFINGVSLAGSFGHTYRFFNDPRTYGIEIRRQF